MEQDTFYETLTGSQTERTKVLLLLSSRAAAGIPKVFTSTFPSIIANLTANLDKICRGAINHAPTITLFDLQVPVVAIWSELPQKLHRVIDARNPGQHFCRILRYYRNLVIDFTTGEIMDDNQYLRRLNLTKKPGMVLGLIDPVALSNAWQLFNSLGEDHYAKKIF